MFRILQASALMAIVLVVTNESEAKTRGTAKGSPARSSMGNTGKIGTTINKAPTGGTKTPVHGPGSSHDPKGPTKTPVHGPGSSHDPKGPTRTHYRDYREWSHRRWNSSYGCDFCWSGVYGCYFYFYAPAGCYYPVSCIEQFPPTAAPAPVAAAPVVPVAPVTPIVRVTIINQNTLVNR